MPRMGMGMPLVATAQSSAINVQDFFWLNDISSELTPIRTASRTNLLTYSEDFSQSVWQKQSGIIPTYNTTETLSPVGTNNATKFIGTGSTGVFKSSVSVSGNISRSVYLKSVSGTTTAKFKDPNATGGATPVNLTITNEWQRFELIGDNGTSAQGLWIDDIPVSGVYMWGAQVEQDSRVSAYIPTSGSAVTVATTLNDTHDIWDFDNADLMPEEDPDSEGVWERRPNLVTNHDFAADSNWTKGTGWTISGGTASCDGSQSANTTLVQQQGILGVTLDIQVGNAYELIFTLTRAAGGITNTEVGGTTEGTTISSSGTHSKIITASSTNDRITFTATPDFVGSIDNVTLKEYAITPLDV